MADEPRTSEGGKRIFFTAEEFEALTGIVENWISEGFTSDPWDRPVYASIFEKTNVDQDWLERQKGHV